MSLPYDSVKDQVREAIDIVELVSRYVPLRRQGANYVGRCPWHDDSRPSLQVNPQRQSYKCWVCNLGGDVFSFVMQMEKVDFKEALEILADRAGIALPKPKKPIRLARHPAEESGQPEQNDLVSKKTLFEAMHWAAEQYHEALLTLDEALPARKYLEERGIATASWKQFLLGYAPLDRDWWIKKVKGKQRQIAILETVGILTRRSVEEGEQPGFGQRTNQPYDRFRGRVLFPIRDTQDRTVAFGGRVLPNSPFASRAKYLNSPETPLFSKQRMLYGLDVARLAMAKTRRALIMEGYTDCIMAHQHGFGDAVAVLGTAVNSEHIRMLRRFADKMILVLDGDEAGQKRMEEVLELFVAQGVDMAVLTLPGGEDPCEFLEQHGAEGFRTLIEHDAVDALEHAFLGASRGIDIDRDVIGASRALDKLLRVIVQAPAQLGEIDEARLLRLEKMIQRLSRRFGIDEKQIRHRLRQLRQGRERRTVVGHPEVHEAEQETRATVWGRPESFPDSLEREMLELCLIDPGVIYTFWERLETERFRSPITRAIYQRINELVDREIPPTFDRLMTSFDEPRMKSFLVDLDESGRAKRLVRPAPTKDSEGNTIEHEPIEQPYDEETKAKLIEEVVQGFERRESERYGRLEIGRLKEGNLSEEEKRSALAAILEQQKRKHQRGVDKPD